MKSESAGPSAKSDICDWCGREIVPDYWGWVHVSKVWTHEARP